MADYNINDLVIDSSTSTADLVINNTGLRVNIRTGSGADTITNQGQYVTIDAGMGNDSIISNGTSGYGSYASIDGGNGDDTIYIGRDNTVAGGLGDDMFIYRTGIGNAVLTDYAAVGDNDVIKIDGADTDLKGITESGNDYIIKVGAEYSLTLKEAKDKATSLRFRFNDFDSVTSSHSNLSIDGTGVDKIVVNSTGVEKVTIKGGAGGDTINSSGSYNVIDTGDGNDIINATGTTTSCRCRQEYHLRRNWRNYSGWCW